jgi:hypothetical protein
MHAIPILPDFRTIPKLVGYRLIQTNGLATSTILVASDHPEWHVGRLRLPPEARRPKVRQKARTRR